MSGLRAWLIQRATAVYLLVFVAAALLRWLLDPPLSYQAWRLWIASPGAALATTVFVVALLMHAWVGLRDVILDYLPSMALRFTALALLASGLLAIAAWLLAVVGRAVAL